MFMKSFGWRAMKISEDTQHDSSVVFNKHVLTVNYLGNTKMRRKAGLDRKKFRAYHRRPSSKKKTPIYSCKIYHSDIIRVLGSFEEGH